MLSVKQNHPTSHQDKACRVCKNAESSKTQQHVIEECQYITGQLPQKIRYKDIFKENDPKAMKTIATTLKSIEEIIENQISTK